MTLGKLIDELDREIRVPGLANVWLPPIRSRIDMQATGIKSPVGIKVSGSDLATIEKVAEQVVQSLRTVRGTASAVAERLSSGRYIDVTIDRLAAARYGLNVSDIQDVIASAVGGENVTETVEGLERYPVNVRFPRELRDSLALVQALPIATEKGATIPLSAVAKVAINDGPSMLRSENARPSAWIYVDIRGRDLSGYVREAQRLIAAQVALPPGYSLTWSGQFEYLERAARRLSLVVPMTLAAILLLLYLAFAS
jgi:Cu(I)/Ag(I) efflux system membrane protein CusA/SilA